MKLCEKIVLLRKKAGLSQEAMAEKLGVSRQAVSRWEVGSALPDASNVLQLSRLFSVTADYLLNEDFDSDQDVPAVRCAAQKARYHLQRVVGVVLAAVGALGNLMIYIISRCVKVYAPLRQFDPSTGRFLYYYDSIPRINYSYFVKEYHLVPLIVVFWILAVAGIGLILWSLPSVQARIQPLRKKSAEAASPVQEKQDDGQLSGKAS